jgi:phosphoribosylglycinamide formyltransferase-1
MTIHSSTPIASPKKIVILISGRGSNMMRLVEACQQEQWPAEIAAVISNQPDAAGLQWAAERGIPTHVIHHKNYADRSAFDAALQAQIDTYPPDLVVLAGFMRILTPTFTAHYAGRLMNIHPSLLPSFGGLHTHQRAIEAGVKFHGATVHFVTAELDYGPIIQQSCVAVAADDTADTLAAKVLATEYAIYPQAVRWFVEDRLQIDGMRVRVV